MVANCDHLSNLRFTQNLPFAFTEHGAVMLANVLNSPDAVKASIEVVRAFVRLRTVLASHEGRVRKVNALEQKCDAQFRAVFDAIRQLMAPPKPKKNQVGFHWEQKKASIKKPAKKKSPSPKRKTPANTAK